MDLISFLDVIHVLDLVVRSGAGVSPYAVLVIMVVSSLSILTTR